MGWCNRRLSRKRHRTCRPRRTLKITRLSLFLSTTQTPRHREGRDWRRHSRWQERGTDSQNLLDSELLGFVTSHTAWSCLSAPQGSLETPPCTPIAETRRPDWCFPKIFLDSVAHLGLPRSVSWSPLLSLQAERGACELTQS